MTIRDAIDSDATAIAGLVAELGYEAGQEEVQSRLARLKGRDDQMVVVAIKENRIVGWIQAHASEVLESGFRAEIVGLVVSQSFRRSGVGRSLVSRAEQWAVEIGAAVLVVRSNTKRVESHSFYPVLGFTLSKTQAVYRKYLKNEPNKTAQRTGPSARR